MNLDITGKVGIENAHSALNDIHHEAFMELEDMKYRHELHWKVRLQEKYVEGLEKGLEIVTINLPAK